MVFFASTALEKLQEVPTAFWVKAALIILGFIAAVVVFRFIRGTNKIVITVVVFITVSIACLSWVYNRNEPSWMTWLIEPVANSGLLPTKGAYEVRQQEDPSKPGLKKNPTTQPAKAPAKPGQPSQPASKK